MPGCGAQQDISTSNELARSLQACVNIWIPQEQREVIPIFVASDNASNIRGALQQLPHFSALRCFAHTLQLAVNDLLKQYLGILRVMALARNIVTHFRHRMKYSRELLSNQIVAGAPHKQ